MNQRHHHSHNNHFIHSTHFGNVTQKKALLGAIVGDAATMPLHWIYDRTTLLDSITSKDKVKCEFNSIPSCPFYSSREFPNHYHVGQQSPYGEQLVALWEILQQNDSQSTRNAITIGVQNDNYGDDGDHIGNMYASKFYSWLQTYTGRKDEAAKKFEQNYENGLRYPACGANDDQAMSLYKSVLAFAAGIDKLSDLEPLVRFHQNNDLAWDCAQFLYSMIREASLSQRHSSKKTLSMIYHEQKIYAPESLKQHFDFLDDQLQLDSVLTANEFLDLWEKTFKSKAVTCHNPQALLRVLYISIHASSYEDGIRANILVGGDNASTAIGIGSLLGIFYDVPEEWIQRTTLLS